MRSALSLFAFALIVFLHLPAAGQSDGALKATAFGFLPEPVSVASIAQQIQDGTFIEAAQDDIPRLGQPKRSGANITVPGKGLPIENDALVNKQMSTSKHQGRLPLLVFDANVSTYTPSDPTGAVGPNHYVGGWNVGFRIFDKTGNPLTPAASLSTLFPGNAIGDPIVLYDVAADRFIITEFDNSPNGFNVAICKGSDPVNDGWWVYTTGFTTGSFPDYPKFSVWSDGYYVTANINTANRTYVLERDKMLGGLTAKFVALPLPSISTSGFYSPQAFNVTNGSLPPPGNGYVVYLQDDAWSNVSVDHLKIWTINVDWNNIANSTISAPQIINTTPFIAVFDGGSFTNRPQPSGPQQDVLQATIMNQAQYRRFPNYNSAIFNFVVDTDATAAELAGIRWYELRQYGDGTPWVIYQEGTYISPANNKDAFSGSMAMDGQGNIGMGYTTVSTQEMIAIYYTGRLASDPLGVMTVNETLLAQSTTNNPSNRLADYVHLTVDPMDDLTFWHIAEYFKTNQRRDVVGVFKIGNNLANDIGIMSIDAPKNGFLTQNEPVKITLFNYGINSQVNIPVKYSIDNGNVVSETFAGPIPSGTSVQFTFSSLANLSIEGKTYKIAAACALDADQNAANDTISKKVTFIYARDIGVTAVLAPVSGSGLTASEPITVSLRNYGSVEQSNFPISYILNGSMVSEVVPNPLPFASTISYTFTTQGNLSAVTVHKLRVFTSLAGDVNRTNDTTTVQITNTMCMPQSSCARGIGFRLFNLGTISNITGCAATGYENYTAQKTILNRSTTHKLIVGTERANQNLTVWIDFNDNFLFEANEALLSNYPIANNQAGPNFYDTIAITIPANASLGEHILRAKISWGIPVPDNACQAVANGETEDYTVDINLYTGQKESVFRDAEMIVSKLGNNKFEVTLTTDLVNETMIFNVHNVLGHKLVENRVDKIGGKYTYVLDMSYAPKGVYIVRFGTYNFGKVRRIQVN